VLVLTLGQAIAMAGPAAQQPAPARPIEPITAVLDAFRSHRLVALGEPHGNEQAHAFRLALIRDPRFATVVNDIVVESGSALHQDLMDRFIRGDSVPAADIRQAWQDTTQHLAWDTPIYEQFFRAVRELNAALPAQRRIRVLLGDPPIDWNAVKTPQDHFQWMRLRDSFPADLIHREVVAKQRRALLAQRGTMASRFRLQRTVPIDEALRRPRPQG
jgi:hypothetical protein